MSMEDLDAGQALLALPETAQGAGVVLIPAWWGLNDFFQATAERLAAEGFVVIVPDLYDGEVAATVEQAEALRDALDFDRVEQMLNQSVDFLAQHPAVSGDGLGLIGFSLGASLGLWLANHRPDAIAAVVAFYGTFGGDLSAMRAAFQGHFAEKDDFEPREGVEALDQTLTEMGLEATFFIYAGTGHWFFEADRDAYHAESARLSWDWTLKFLREKLGAPMG